jgi:hypothetical protein
MKIAFGVLSSHESQAAVEQLVRSLGSFDPVIVHHDYSKQRGFALAGTQAHLIHDYVETSWGSSSIPRAIFHLIRTALAHHPFDYFQLLSASCLPLRPIEELRQHLAAGQHAIYADILNLDSDEGVMMSHGHRVFCRADRMASRLLNWSRRCYFGDAPATVQQANLGIAARPVPHARLTARQWLGRKVHRAARAGLLDRHPFRKGVQPFIGSLWFCLRRDVCEYLVKQEEAHAPLSFLLGLKVCDEILFATTFGNSPFGHVPSNHFVSDFCGSHPRPLEVRDFHRLESSNKFFARKFLTESDDTVRQLALARLVLPSGIYPQARAAPS